MMAFVTWMIPPEQRDGILNLLELQDVKPEIG